MSVETTPWNPFEYMETQEEINDFLRELLREEDSGLFVSALGHLAKQHGMTELAQAVGVNRESLYRSFNGSVSPRFDTIHKVIRALGLNLKVA
ncbi:MAG: putative addiction module antidote protein [Gammaproteobacteria bacterium]|nr:MAG: putative addiction module antidote protein [Gammaproteobacteria bacterium]